MLLLKRKSGDCIAMKQLQGPFVHNFFELNKAAVDQIRSNSYHFGYGQFSEAVFYRTYSLYHEDIDHQEDFYDVVLRCTNGQFSIRKDHYLKHGIAWDEAYWQDFATRSALAFLKLKWCPPGRGWSKMGTQYIYERGSMCLNNCAYTNTDNLSQDCGWAMDALMLGCGVGFGVTDEPLKIQEPNRGLKTTFMIPDSREGWVEGLELLIRSYEEGTNTMEFDASGVRPRDTPIKGFGGTASGPEPLLRLYEATRETLERYLRGEITPTRAKADIMNNIGCCVVAGNVRRSAEIMLGSINNSEFLDLKQYSKISHIHRMEQEAENFKAEVDSREPTTIMCSDPLCRCTYGWMSNNSVILKESEDFMSLVEIAERIKTNGEPGFINMKNIRKYGRYGKEVAIDDAEGINPCGEIPLRNHELCNLADQVPSRNISLEDFKECCEFAATYMQAVSLLPTHRPETNIIITKNRRVGGSLTGIADWRAKTDYTEMTRWMKEGYWVHRNTNNRLAKESCVAPAIRVTTMKPAGTDSKIIGVCSGIHPPLAKYIIRRIVLPKGSPIEKTLRDSNYPIEDCVYDDNSTVAEFPLCFGDARPFSDISMWEQAMMAEMAQREWADNAVSVTIYYKQHEEEHLEHLIAQIAPVVKTLSVLPADKKTYEQAPEEIIDEQTYNELKAKVKDIDWSNFTKSYGYEQADSFCTGDSCEL